MFKISIIETPSERRLVVEGKLMSPWAREVVQAWKDGARQLEGRSLLVDLTNVTLIGPDGEEVLSELMQAGAKFACAGVLTSHLVKQLARKHGCKW
jgi:hypothetical protein